MKTFIELSVRVSDGSYESQLRVPVDSTEQQRNGFAKMWLNMMLDALALPPSEPESPEKVPPADREG